MELTTAYIASQIFTIITYILLALTYYPKKRSSILIIAFLSTVANAVVYILLNAYSGLAMCGVSIVKNVIFLVDEIKNGKSDKIAKKDVIILAVLYIITIVFAIITYEGFLSLLSVFANMIYIYSCWQKNPTTYKLLGIPTEILWVLYNIYIKSIFGIILEIVVLIASIMSYVAEIKKGEKKDEQG